MKSGAQTSVGNWKLWVVWWLLSLFKSGDMMTILLAIFAVYVPEISPDCCLRRGIDNQCDSERVLKVSQLETLLLRRDSDVLINGVWVESTLLHLKRFPQARYGNSCKMCTCWEGLGWRCSPSCAILNLLYVACMLSDSAWSASQTRCGSFGSWCIVSRRVSPLRWMPSHNMHTVNSKSSNLPRRKG